MGYLLTSNCMGKRFGGKTVAGEPGNHALKIRNVSGTKQELEG
jgi:hypothetical protein